MLSIEKNIHKYITVLKLMAKPLDNRNYCKKK